MGCRPYNFESMKTVVGQNFNPLGLFACRVLRPHMPALDIMNQDWVHGFLCNGTLVREIECLLHAIGFTREECEAFLQAEWHFPKSTGRPEYHRIFSEFRIGADDGDGIRVRVGAS